MLLSKTGVCRKQRTLELQKAVEMFIKTQELLKKFCKQHFFSNERDETER